VKTILVADDEQDLLLTLLVSLRQGGYEVVTAQNGLQAVQRAISDPPDLILMDVNMPVMNGFEAVQKLKSDPVTADIPIVMLTADHSSGSMAIGFEAGSDLYLTKPFSPNDIVEQLHTLLEN
jgi:CheY-like chemotaxis protein